jgi:hypothetical protein
MAQLSGSILSDTFLGTAVPPQNWMEFSGGAHDIAHTPGVVTMTDSTGNTTGIVSTLPTSAFSPVGNGVMTTLNAVIHSLSTAPSLGNAVVGLVGVNQTGSLAAGIDGKGNVFLAWSQANPPISQANLVIGKDSKYTGGTTELSFIIYQDYVQVVTPGFTSADFKFSQLNTKFSLVSAFPGGAIPALAAASQPGAAGGVASFSSITVGTSGT